MTAIRVNSSSVEDEIEPLLSEQSTRPTLVNNSNGSYQLKGVVSDSSTTRQSRSKTEAGWRAAPQHNRRNSFSEIDGRDRAGSRLSMPTSLRSEPDLDTIMPLPGRLSQDEYGRPEEDEEDEDTPSFTNVEVRAHAN